MSAKIILPPVFKGIIDEDPIEVEGKSVGECLSALVSLHPILGKELFEGGGKLKTWIEIYVNTQSTYPEELAYPVKDGDKIWVILLMAGG